MKPLFILGLGAQKSGSSWLHSTLSNQDNVNLGFIKEYHVWDYVFSPVSSGFRARLENPDNAVSAMRRMMQESPEMYTKYFQGLIDSRVKVTGDITPGYSVIDESGLRNISRILKEAHFELKVIFLLRDPIERIWSAIRMEKRNRMRKGEVLEEDFCDSRAQAYIRSEAHLLRSDYKRTVQNITKVFDEGEVHFELYERLFTKQAMVRLESFLDFKLGNVDFSERVNESFFEPRSEETTRLLSEFLAPQYEFCRQQFEDIENLWSGIGQN